MFPDIVSAKNLTFYLKNLTTDYVSNIYCIYIYIYIYGILAEIDYFTKLVTLSN